MAVSPLPNTISPTPVKYYGRYCVLMGFTPSLVE
jgi:hypothetical protein